MANQHSQLEELFAINFRAFGNGLPTPQREYRFHPRRNWRVDFAWPKHLLAVEVEGGIYTQGRHTHVTGFLKDIEKYNALAEAGFTLLRFAQPHIEDDPQPMIDQIRRVLTNRKTAPVE